MGARAMVSKVDGSICDSDFGIETAFSFSSTAPNKSPEVEDAIGGTSTVDCRLSTFGCDATRTIINRLQSMDTGRLLVVDRLRRLG